MLKRICFPCMDSNHSDCLDLTQCQCECLASKLLTLKQNGEIVSRQYDDITLALIAFHRAVSNAKKSKRNQQVFRVIDSTGRVRQTFDAMLWHAKRSN